MCAEFIKEGMVVVKLIILTPSLGKKSLNK